MILFYNATYQLVSRNLNLRGCGHVTFPFPGLRINLHTQQLLI